MERECIDFIRTATEEELARELRKAGTFLASLRIRWMGIDPDG